MAQDSSNEHGTPGPDNEPNESNAAEGSEATASGPSGQSAQDGAFTESGDFVQAEGPDVETSLSDADLSFLDDVEQGVAAESDLAAERLADLQRVTAEYANYRKRTEAGREVERERTTSDVLKSLLPVLDDLDRAEKHGDLHDGPFVSIAAKLRASVERQGLAPFGAQGDIFDPQLHEAIFQQPTPGVEEPTIADVVETGYFLGSTLVRAAKVVVAVPAS